MKDRATPLCRLHFAERARESIREKRASMSEPLIASSSRETEHEHRERSRDRSRDRSREDSSNSAARANNALHHPSWQMVTRHQDPLQSNTPRSQSAASGDPMRPTAIRDYESEAADNLEVFGE